MTISAQRYFVEVLQITPGMHAYSQTVLADRMAEQLSGLIDPENVVPLIRFTYSQSGIDQRYLELPLEDVETRVDWYQVVNEALRSLAARCLRQAFSTGIEAGDCDGLIVVSGTHCGYPSISRKLQQELGFSERTLCFDLGGYGCAGVPHAIYLGHMLLSTGRCRRVCILSVDAMATSARSRKFKQAPPMSELVAYLLPSDGAAALIISKSASASAPVLTYSECDLQTKLWPDSLDWNVLTVDVDNQPRHFVGRDIRYRAPEELAYFLDEDVIRSPIIMHPGGLALLRQVDKKYPQLSAATKLSATVMKENGNVNAATVLWVLREAFIQKYPLKPSVNIIAIGPGKVTAVLSLKGTE
jgi:predicted naringenin-chalcone synthase